MRQLIGAKAFTVCGDPLYFAPEIITQRGYDYGADIWSFGCLLHDMYEGNTPFGGPDTEETTVFKAITGHV